MNGPIYFDTKIPRGRFSADRSSPLRPGDEPWAINDGPSDAIFNVSDQIRGASLVVAGDAAVLEGRVQPSHELISPSRRHMGDPNNRSRSRMESEDHAGFGNHLNGE
jgi:hypothetical protein